MRLSNQEREAQYEVIGRLNGSSQKVSRVQMLLKSDINGSDWMNQRIVEAFGC